MAHRLGKGLAAATVVSLLVVGCAGPGQGIADRIRAANSPIVREVDFFPGGTWSGRGENIYIYVVDEAADAESLQLWCDVVLPAGAAQLGDNDVVLVKDPSNPILVFYGPPPPCPG